jgi:hypothetical protein
MGGSLRSTVWYQPWSCFPTGVEESRRATTEILDFVQNDASEIATNDAPEIATNDASEIATNDASEIAL